MAKQTIDGDNNVQVGTIEGDFRLERRAPIMREDDPNVVWCPYDCGQLTWYDSEQCWNCTRRVKDYFVEQGRKALLSEREKQITIAVAISAVVLFGAQHLPDSWRIYGICLGFGGLGIAGLLIRDADSIRRA